MTTSTMIEQIDAKLRDLSPDKLTVVWQLVQLITQDQPSSKTRYDFANLPGKWTWQGDAVAVQRRLRDEW
jgi:hypothetical protein